MAPRECDCPAPLCTCPPRSAAVCVQWAQAIDRRRTVDGSTTEPRR